jgi:hypothetical protein
LKECKKLPYTFAYLFAFFLLADVGTVVSFPRMTLTLWGLQGLGTTLTLVSICQNQQFKFSFLKNTYLNLVQVVTSVASIVASWYIQRHWKVDIKKMV